MQCFRGAPSTRSPSVRATRLLRQRARTVRVETLRQESGVRVVYVGRLDVRTKGPDVLVDAASEAARRRPAGESDDRRADSRDGGVLDEQVGSLNSPVP
jgi:hypothetical protein